MIEEQNPWWISEDLIEESETYKKYLEAKIKWYPDFLDKVSLSPFSLNFLFGPRQVGKTTALILFIKKLLDNHVNPKAIFYFSCEKLADYKELDSILEEYLKVKKREGIKTSYIILDEVTYPKEWYRTIKYRIDKGDFKNDVLILSGSLSMKAKGEVENFPGRRGNGKTLIMYPLSFSQYVRLFLKIPFPSQNVDKAVNLAKENFAIRKDVEELFENYLKTGGFPNPIKDVYAHGKINDSMVSDFISTVILEINKLRRSETFFKEVLKGIIDRTSSEVSFHTIAKGIGNVKTIISYIELLQHLYYLIVLFAIDPNDGTPIPKKEKKLYLIDPFLYYAFSKWVFTKMPDESKILESVVVAHLSRLYPTFYLKREKEVDVIIKEEDKYKGIEIKYGNVAKKVIGKIKDFIYLSKDVIDEKIIPTSLFLTFLDIPQTVEAREGI
ncbi:ATP-binding protein [Sulfurisphaera javensis]|uniref:ATP-binding protein n=1 Tax=Sulfurisphaera javensis TaxID=2049879 RepID=A0AAT9GPN3_9CREN